MKLKHDKTITYVPVDQINVLNSRTRGQGKFKQIVGNIANIGLKRPITVARRGTKDGRDQYDLVCGEGRLLALKALGQTEVPVILVEGSKEDLLLSGLAENLARRQFTTVEAARQIVAMRDRGDKPSEIAKKVDLDVSYVNGILRLMKHGEERLLIAVEKRQIPLSLAVVISESSDQDVQRAMTEAYERGELRGRALLRARRILEQRKTRGRAGRSPAGRSTPVSGETLVKAYKKEAARQQMVVQRARQCENRLLFVVSALRKLLADESFRNLLRAENLVTLPQFLADQIERKEAGDGR